MLNNDDNINLEDLIDIRLLQRIQDMFAQTFGLGCIVRCPEGDITKPSNFSELCEKYILQRSVSAQKCRECDEVRVMQAIEEKKPVIYECHLGVVAFVVPIIISGRYFGYLQGGQVLYNSPNEDYFIQAAKDFGIEDEEGYLNAVRKLKIKTRQELSNAVDLISVVINVISEIGHKNLNLLKKNNRDAIYQSIVELTRKSTDISSLTELVCKEIVNLFKVQRVAIVQYVDPTNLRNIKLKRDYKVRPEIQSVHDYDYNKELFAEFWGKALFFQEQILVVENVSESDMPQRYKEIYESIGVKSLLGLPIRSKDSIWGAMIICSYDEYRDWTSEDCDFLSIIADQVFIAIKQAELFEKEKSAFQKETILRSTFEVLRGSLEPQQIMQKFVDVICDHFDADRCIFGEFDRHSDKFLPLMIEKIKSDDIPSLIGVGAETDYPEFTKKVKSGRNVIIPDVEKLYNKTFPKIYASVKTAMDLGVKSDYGLSVHYKDRYYGSLIIQFISKKKSFTHEELDFLKSIREQVAIALYQAELYQEEKRAAQRELAIRKVIEDVRSSLDLNKVKEKITENICKIFNADRCYFRSYDKDNNLFKQVEAEYLSSSDIISLNNIEADNESLNVFLEELQKQNEGYISSTESKGSFPVFIDFTKAKDTPLERYFVKYGITADYAITIVSRTGDVYWLVLHFCKKNPVLTADDKKMIESIGYQIDIAFEQISLYNQARENAQRESLLRSIIEKIRSTLDLEDTLQFVCEELVKIFNVQRIGITQFTNPMNFREYINKKEYKAVDYIRGLDFIGDYSDLSEYWGEHLSKENNVISIDNIFESSLPDRVKYLYDQMGVKSIIGVPIKKGDNVWGILVLSEYNQYRHWGAEEKALFSAIAGQVYIAINQAELFEKEKVAVERERINRNIIEILRSSMDKNIIKKLFVKNIGKLLEADRVFFVEFNSALQQYIPIDSDSEYLSGSLVESSAGNDRSLVPEYIQPLLEKREFNIPNVDEYIQNNYKSQEFRALFEPNIKSSYSFPVLYESGIVGFFCIEFANRVVRLSEEDINRIRGICTQAGVAITHAELFKQAKMAVSVKDDIVKKIAKEIKSSLSGIVELSGVLSKYENHCDKEYEYLDKLNSTILNLMSQTGDLLNVEKTD